MLMEALFSAWGSFLLKGGLFRLTPLHPINTTKFLLMSVTDMWVRLLKMLKAPCVL